MEPTYYLVVCIKDGCDLSSSDLFTNDLNKAQIKFTDKIKELNPSIDQGDIDAAYYMQNNTLVMYTEPYNTHKEEPCIDNVLYVLHLDMTKISPMNRDKIMAAIDSEVSRLDRNLSADIHESQTKNTEMIGWQKGLYDLGISIRDQHWKWSRKL